MDKTKHITSGDYKKLEVGVGSLGRARMQIKVSQTTNVTYDVYGGGVARPSPEISF